MMRSNYNLKTSRQPWQRLCYFSQTAQQSFKVLPCWLPAFPYTPQVETSSSMSSQICNLQLQIHLKGNGIGPVDTECLSPALPGSPDGHPLSPVNCGISPQCDSGQTTSTHTLMLPVRKVHHADVDRA